MHPLDADFQIVRDVWRKAAWPGVEEGLSYGTPALKVKKKLLIRIREPNVAVIMCDFNQKEFLLQAAPDVYYQTDHYAGYPAILARLDVIDQDELSKMIETAWRPHATKQMLAEFATRAKDCD